MNPKSRKNVSPTHVTVYSSNISLVGTLIAEGVAVEVISEARFNVLFIKLS